MRRRRLLRALGGASAASLAWAGNAVGGSGVPKVVTVESAAARGIAFDAELLRPRATAEHPPRVRLTWRNTAEQFVELDDLRTYPDWLSSIPPAAGGESALRLYGNYGPGPGNRVAPDCWRVAHPLPIPAAEAPPLALWPGESETRTYDCWSPRRSGRCLPVGTYRFGATDDRPWWRLVLRVSR